ncbi:D-serine dehydratase [Oikeobacillus pervagus]|uniref:Probable D-serine dehydratase n=1 Tax=Oikeobacillus pervagus TaxID=1325931 RepID=A0AAJ1SY95_9BACI|nr:D-serine dehydratase [Oikeobacillus pervagus]
MDLLGKSLNTWLKKYPLLQKLIQKEEVVWIQKDHSSSFSSITIQDIHQAEERLKRFAPLIEKAFPETKKTKGIIESPLLPIQKMASKMLDDDQKKIEGKWLLKGDHALPIAGSIKARGGIYEVLKIAEQLAVKEAGFNLEKDYRTLLTPQFRSFFSKYSISVGSTGNLGLSIGIMSEALGFKVTVHMSSDAKKWKKDVLKRKGVQVIEHLSDYSLAVEMGRRACKKDPYCHFIDDEHSIDLFLGYAVAALRLERQLRNQHIIVDENHPLFVYLPCGVGGGPGGIAYALKLLYGNHVHCFFAEPTHSPCMLLGVMTGLHDQICVQDFGLDNKTDADGLAVGRPSSFVGKTVGSLLSGIYTVNDEQLYKLLYLLHETEGIDLEPSALAGMYGPIQLQKYGWFDSHFSQTQLNNSHHLVWATGGQLVPEEIMREYVEKGKLLNSKRG